MRTPSGAETLVRGFLADPDLQEAVLGDLAEEWGERAADDGAGAADAWYRVEALRTAPHLLARRPPWSAVPSPRSWDGPTGRQLRIPNSRPRRKR